MLETLAHRGPNHAGVWSDREHDVCLGNRRLAILDLSAAGHQPMVSRCGRYAITLNGEIYNHAALRRTLEEADRACIWRGRSDTEVLVAAIALWGIERALRASNGMFAVAIWDRSMRELTLARDRLGEKPLHYARCGSEWLFGSELKALTSHERFDATIDRRALADYIALGYVPAPATIHAAARKVLPGCMIRLRGDDSVAREVRYWSAADAARRACDPPSNDSEAIDRLESLLSDAVSQQMVADRPVGALLSGGIDSSSIVALMAARGASSIETFSIGFRERHYDEARFAASVAAHFGTRHTELYVDANDVRDTIPLLPHIYDEPFADISQIPTYLVSRLASGSVTVALTGDGGDELFGGYPRYRMGARMWPAIERTPAWIRASFGLVAARLPSALDHAFAWAWPHDEVSGHRGIRPAQKLNKLARALRSPDLEALYWRLLAPGAAATYALERRGAAPAAAETSRTGTVEEEFMFRDLVGYLPDDILAKVDRASMAVGLESRAPFLDHRIVEFALSLPYAMKFRDRKSKWLLREVLYRHVPQALVDRPKMGFEMPIASWMRGPLKGWAHDLLASSGGATDLVDLAAVRRMLDRHVSGVGDGHRPLWTALMLLNWERARRHAQRSSSVAPTMTIDVPTAFQPPGAPA